jgi:hypothetical protein
MTDRDSDLLQYVTESFVYADGALIWKERPVHHFVDEWRQRIFNSRQAGSEAGAVWNGYRMVNFKRRKLGVHRIVFLMHHGYLPAEVDHIDGNSLNNRIENLRAATHQENTYNRGTYKNNTSGRKGVSWHKPTSKWAAGIRENGKWKHLGLFESFDAAVACRTSAELVVYGEFANER